MNAPVSTDYRPPRRARSPIPKKLRFEVLRRDHFTCRYCGRQPPEVVLHLDHVIAVANGGANTLENLITACAPCNIGKGVMDASAPAGNRLAAPVGVRPRVEFFWLYDYADGSRVVLEARCLESPDWTVSEVDRRWHWSEYFHYVDSPYPRHFSTHGASSSGFSPHEGAMYAAEILHNKWQSFDGYITFLDDILIATEAGHLPTYIAPFVLRSLHVEVANYRCGRVASKNEDLLDGITNQADAVFSQFLGSQHKPWSGR